MFVPVSVCWIVNRIIQKLQNRSAWNLDGGQFSTHKRPHLLLVQIWIKGTHPGGEFWDFHDIFVCFSGNDALTMMKKILVHMSEDSLINIKLDLASLKMFYEGSFCFSICSTLINRDINLLLPPTSSWDIQDSLVIRLDWIKGNCYGGMHSTVPF